MQKNWRSAPWSVRIIFLFWLTPVVVTAILHMLLLVVAKTGPINDLWELPFKMLAAEYEAMPIITSIDVSFMLMGVVGAYYGWRLVHGEGFARAVLELFCWLELIYISVPLFWPEVQYFEVDSVPPDALDYPFAAFVMGLIILALQILVLVLLRSGTVQNYADTA